MPFKSKTSRIIIPVVEMTPMIDIIFLLIIFFMVAAKFAQQATIDLNLPDEIGEETPIEMPSALIINLTADGDIIVDTPDNILTLDDLDTRISALIENESASWELISLRADEHAETSALNDILRVLNKHGLSATRIATESP
ncbi:MAG: biopolymer transporter ExbD [Phycisphaerales bacterium]|nr:biopolymer transporter ExbD [Phycisphaerales bacterium]